MTTIPAFARTASGTDFGRTRWSVVAAVQSSGEADARQSLAELCRRYWAPVYAYVRQSGHPPEDAAALVQAFLSHLVQEIRAGNPSAAGGFRVFLHRRLEQFLAKQDQTGHAPVSNALANHAGSAASASSLAQFASPWPLAEIEQRHLSEQLTGLTPAHAFQRAFALELLAQALEQLRREAEGSGREAMFAQVRPFLTREPAQGEYADLAARLHSSPLATVIAVKRLRQRYQELVDAQLAQTVGGPEAFDAERSALLAMLAAPSA